MFFVCPAMPHIMEIKELMRMHNKETYMLIYVHIHAHIDIIMRILHMCSLGISELHCKTQDHVCPRSQGSKKVPSGHPGQVDSPSGQVAFHSYLSNGQGIRQIVCQLSHY